MVRRRQKGDPPSPRLYKEGHYPPSCRDTRFTLPYHTIHTVHSVSPRAQHSAQQAQLVAGEHQIVWHRLLSFWRRKGQIVSTRGGQHLARHCNLGRIKPVRWQWYQNPDPFLHDACFDSFLACAADNNEAFTPCRKASHHLPGVQTRVCNVAIWIPR